jgi:Uma2 family endonuclease
VRLVARPGASYYTEAMGNPAMKHPSVYEAFLAAPDHLVAEIIHGVLHLSPRPASPHARAASSLGISVGGPFDRGMGGPGGWIILDEPELHLHDEIVVPDLAGWRRERMPEMPHVAFFELAPDWICEVLSPSTTITDRQEKMPLYARAGVTHAWLVDPIARTLEAFRLEHERWTPTVTWQGDVSVSVEPFDAVPLELGALWAR